MKKLIKENILKIDQINQNLFYQTFFIKENNSVQKETKEIFN